VRRDHGLTIVNFHGNHVLGQVPGAVNSEPPADLVRTLRTASPEAVVAWPRELLR
jgi:hypothetical protein